MRELHIGRVYRHFKGDYYLVEGVANDSETGAPLKWRYTRPICNSRMSKTPLG